MRKAFACIRLAILLIAYGILAASIALRVLLTALAIALLYLGGLRWERIKARSMGAAHWIDDRTLRAVHFLRAPLASRA